MRTLLTILATVLVTLALVLGISLGLASLEPSIPVVELKSQPADPTAPPQTQQISMEMIPVETAAAAEDQPTAADRPAVDGVPRYYQTDYPHDSFGNGTISTSGCSVTCLAMVATYLTDHEYLPDQMAYHFENAGKDHVERLISANEQMQLPNVRVHNVQEAFKALEEGKVAIAMMNQNSRFTTEQHFIVLAGLTEDGKIIVNDPLEKNHQEDTYMRNGYANGFEDYDIIQGFTGAWIYDKAAMPEEPFLFQADLPEQDESRYQGYTLTEEDIYELASFLWVEARNESEEVQQAIAEVILNRVMSGEFPNTVHNVIYRTELYDRTKAMVWAEVDMPQYRAVNAAMYGPYVLPMDVYHFSKWETRGDVWGTLGAFTFLHSKSQ